MLGFAGNRDHPAPRVGWSPADAVISPQSLEMGPFSFSLALDIMEIINVTFLCYSLPHVLLGGALWVGWGAFQLPDHWA